MLPGAGITNEEHLARAQRLWRAKTSVLPPTDSSLIKPSITELLQLPAKRSTTAPCLCWQPMATASFPSSLCRRAAQNLGVDLTKTCHVGVAELTLFFPHTEPPRTQDPNYVAKMPVLMKIYTEKSRQFCLLKIQSHSLETAKWNGSAELVEYQNLLKEKIVFTVEQLSVLPEPLPTQARIQCDIQYMLVQANE